MKELHPPPGFRRPVCSSDTPMAHSKWSDRRESHPHASKAHDSESCLSAVPTRSVRNWSPRQELHLHAREGTTFSGWLVCWFRHEAMNEGRKAPYRCCPGVSALEARRLRLLDEWRVEFPFDLPGRGLAPPRLTRSKRGRSAVRGKPPRRVEGRKKVDRGEGNAPSAPPCQGGVMRLY